MTACRLPAQSPERSAYRAYGVDLRCELREIGELWSGDGELVHEAVIAGGAALRIERGAAGDHLIRCGEHSFHLSADRARLACSPPSRPDLLWWGAFLDWVPYSAASLAGLLCIHAAGVLVDGRVLVLAAQSGGGKSTLAAELVAAGATFFCDDVLALEPAGNGVLAHPGPAVARVDAGRPDLVGRLGRGIGRSGDEILVEVTEAASDPAPVRAVVIVERTEDGPEQPLLVGEGLVALRRLVVGLAGPESSERQRFAGLTALLEEASVLRLRVRADVPAASLARHLLAGLREPALP